MVETYTKNVKLYIILHTICNFIIDIRLKVRVVHKYFIEKHQDAFKLFLQKK